MTFHTGFDELFFELIALAVANAFVNFARNESISDEVDFVHLGPAGRAYLSFTRLANFAEICMRFWLSLYICAIK